MYITIIICVLFICATVLSWKYLQIGYTGDDELNSKFEVIGVKITKFLAKVDKAEAEDKSYSVSKKDYREVIEEIQDVLKL